ncbi:MAG: 50S ribosomal protein L30 [Deltaproteobacteria bacterium]|nr:50S ribosomal protein L30 [Deltaproteobacteria bacterium]
MEQIKATLHTGLIACNEKQKKTAWALGLRKRQASKIFKATPSVLGMLNTLAHLVKVEKLSSVKETENPFSKIPEYELGEIRPKVKKEKKVKAVKAVSASEEKAPAKKKAAKPAAAKAKSTPKTTTKKAK